MPGKRASEKQRARAAQALGEGKSLRAAAKAANVAEASTVLRWQKGSPEFRNLVQRSKARSRQVSVELMELAGQAQIDRLKDPDRIDEIAIKDLTQIHVAATRAIDDMEDDDPTGLDLVLTDDEALEALAADLTPEQVARLQEIQRARSH
jgi:hypothetical protein